MQSVPRPVVQQRPTHQHSDVRHRHSRQDDLPPATLFNEATYQAFTGRRCLGMLIQPFQHLLGGLAFKHLVSVDLPTSIRAVLPRNGKLAPGLPRQLSAAVLDIERRRVAVQSRSDFPVAVACGCALCLHHLRCSAEATPPRLWEDQKEPRVVARSEPLGVPSDCSFFMKWSL